MLIEGFVWWIVVTGILYISWSPQKDRDKEILSIVGMAALFVIICSIIDVLTS